MQPAFFASVICLLVIVLNYDAYKPIPRVYLSRRAPTTKLHGWKDIVQGVNRLFKEKEDAEVLWIPFLKEGKLNAGVLIMYLTFYLGVTKKDDWIGLGKWRISPADASRNLAVGETNDHEVKEYSFRLMFLEQMPKGTFGTADLKFELYTGDAPGLKISRFRPSQTPGSKQAELELIDLVLDNLELIVNDPTIKPENRVFEVDEGQIAETRDYYVTTRKST